MTHRMTRFSGDLYEDAVRAGHEDLRSTRQQLEYWARIGKSLTVQDSSHSRRVRAALEGSLASEHLTYEESLAFDAQFEARLHTRLADTDLSCAANQSVKRVGNLSRSSSGELVLTISSNCGETSK